MEAIIRNRFPEQIKYIEYNYPSFSTKEVMTLITLAKMTANGSGQTEITQDILKEIIDDYRNDNDFSRLVANTVMMAFETKE